MSSRKPDGHDDAALKAARYRAAHVGQEPFADDEYERRAAERARQRLRSAGIPAPEDDGAAADGPPSFHSTDDAWKIANLGIDQAIARGDFDQLAYAGKPLPDLATHDPDWWIKGLMKREHISGVGPPALLLRTEDARMEETLDSLPSEAQVRESIADFNHRIIEARRQLQGGPPVITRIRDADEEVRRWRERRLARQPAGGEPARAGQAAAPTGRRWWRRLVAWLATPTK